MKSSAACLRRPGIARLVISGLVMLSVGDSPSVGHAANLRQSAPGGVTCNDDTQFMHHWARTWSGSSSTDVGTLITSRTPSSWSVPQPDGNSNEAAWIMNASNSGDSIEVGAITGYWPYGRQGFTNSMVSYMTDTDGQGNAWNNIDGMQWASNQDVTLAVYQNASNNEVGVWTNGATNTTVTFVDTLYGGVTEPIANYAQGEVHDDASWMGGGSGKLFSGYWTNDKSGNSWYLWGSNGGCSTNSGYFEQGGGDSYSNGGYSAK